jgi:hypothetical protein
MFHAGDETDQYFGGLYKRSADGLYSAVTELRAAKEELRRWYAKYPQMKLATSNHGQRWAKKAFEAEIPSELLREYRDVIEAPKGWVWKDRWDIRFKHRVVRLQHGMGYSGIQGHRTAAVDNGLSTIIGHLHSSAGIANIKTDNLDIFGFNVGCLIDVDAYAFEYGRWNRHKPCLGIGVVVDGGRRPIWVPYEGF